MAKFRLKKTPSQYLDMGTPPCSHCECTHSIKWGYRPCPYLDSPFYMKVSKCRVEELKTNPHCFVDFPYLYLINFTFERISMDDDIWEISTTNNEIRRT